MTPEAVRDVEALEAVVGATPPPMRLKVIDHLDAGALRWLSEAPVGVFGLGGGGGMAVALAGGAAGFATGEAGVLTVPLAAIDDASAAAPRAAFGGLFLIPGVGETLRVNGRIEGRDAGQLRIAVAECYGHCAKALIRSELWAAAPAAAPDDPAAFVAESRFLGLASMSAAGLADLSPKGDPAGAMAQLDDDALWFADRPGNRRVDSFRNIVEQPKVALALIIPGAAATLAVRGRAELTTDPAARERFVVQGKTPALAVRVAIETLERRDSPALARANLWPTRTVSDIDPAAVFVEHMKLNKTRGAAAALARASLSVPGALDVLKAGLAKNYRDGLY